MFSIGSPSIYLIFFEIGSLLIDLNELMRNVNIQRNEHVV